MSGVSRSANRTIPGGTRAGVSGTDGAASRLVVCAVVAAADVGFTDSGDKDPGHSATEAHEEAGDANGIAASAAVTTGKPETFWTISASAVPIPAICAQSGSSRVCIARSSDTVACAPASRVIRFPSSNLLRSISIFGVSVEMNVTATLSDSRDGIGARFGRSGAGPVSAAATGGRYVGGGNGGSDP
ncbi:MAG: hypothetical protein OXC53_01580 [Rhodobacteraceae bacterium]|nr:hypothetical protein [Paracoccaceae bacterium]